MLFKMVFSSVERVRLQGGVVAPMYENVGQGRQTPPSPRPPPPTSLQPSVTLDIFRQMSNIIISGVLFFVTKIRGTLWQEISPHHHPQWPEFVSPAFRGWPPRGLKIQLEGLPKGSKFYQMESQVRFPPFLREMRPLFIRPSLAVCRKLVLFSPDDDVHNDVDGDDNFNDDVDGDNDWCW